MFVRPARRAALAVSILTLGLFSSRSVDAASDVTITVLQGGNHVAGAFVALVGPGASKSVAVAGASGQAFFPAVPDGSYVAYASAPGTSAGSVAIVVPGATAKTITLNGSGTVFSPLPLYGARVKAIVADGLLGVSYAQTSAIPGIYRSIDFGASWTPVTISSDDKTFGIDGAGTILTLTTSGFPGEIAATTSTRKAYYSADFGVTWESVSLPSNPSNNPSGQLLWSHPAASGALSMLFFAPTAVELAPAMYFASLPTAANSAPPSVLTKMAVPYRDSANDRLAIDNGSDAGIMVVATVSCCSARSALGDISFYRIGVSPDGIADPRLVINNQSVPGVTPTTREGDRQPLTGSDVQLVRLGGPLTGRMIGTTRLPNTLLVYSSSPSSPADAALTTCTETSCTATTMTTCRDLGDLPSANGSSGNFCGTSRVDANAGQLLASVSPRGDAGAVGSFWLTRNGTGLDARQVSGLASADGLTTMPVVFDAGYDGTSNRVLLSTDGAHGPVKSARPGADAAEGLNRPYFPPYPAVAGAGTATTTGGAGIRGLLSAVVQDVAFNPSAATQLVAMTRSNGGGRVAGSTDAGKTWFDVFPVGGNSFGWWNGTGGSQWLLAGVTGANSLAAVELLSATGFGTSTMLTAISKTSAIDFGFCCTFGSATIEVIEGMPGTDEAVVVVTAVAINSRTFSNLAVVKLTRPGPGASITVLPGTPSDALPGSLAYCDPNAPGAIADKMFVALIGVSTFPGGSRGPGGLQVVTNASKSTRSLQSLAGITGDFHVIRTDCATATVWAGKNTVASGGASGSGTPGLLKSTDGGATFAPVTTFGRANEILQKVQTLAFDPRASGHVVVGSTDGDVVETRDGGFTWSVVNDSATASCPDIVTGPCGHVFGGTPRTIKLPPTAGFNNDRAVIATPGGLHLVSTRTAQRATLAFGGVVRNGSVIITGSQSVMLSLAAGVSWTATSNQPFVVVSPSSGTGGGSFTVSIANTSGTALQPGTYNATITLQTTGALVSTQTLAVAFTVVAASAAPFGVFDTPADQSTGVQGSISVTGWALDDIDIDRVELWRDVAPGETTPPVTTQNPADPRNGKIFISNATFVEGARPDVEVLYGSAPRSYRAGWGYLMLTWGLWNQGNGPFTLYAFGFDKEANISTIGTKAINVNNNAANKPFGSVDTPGIGATVSGTVVNFGWGLTPNLSGVPTCRIQPSGVQVSIDSGPLQPVVYGDNRTDVAGAFTGFSNSNGAGGHYILDTTQYANGPHTIGWLITDDCNRADGVGSRFFNIQNGSQVAGSRAALAPSVQVQADESRVDSPDAVTVAHGHGSLPAIVAPDATGLRMVDVVQGDRIEVRLPRGYGEAYQRVNGVRRALPVGATWDAANGTFYWQPAAAFLGSYEIVFADHGEQIRVRIFVNPR